MKTCTFCSQENVDEARSCLACGKIFSEDGDAHDAAGAAPPPGANPETGAGTPAIPDAELAAELGALSAPTPVARDDAPHANADGEPPDLSSLYDPEPVAKAARNVTIMAAISGLAALGVAVMAGAATADAIDQLGSDATVFFTTPDLPDIAGRSDLLALAEHSLFAGLLVMLGGWAQEAAATRSLLGVPAAHDARSLLRAFVVLGPNVVAGGRAMQELWRDSDPHGGPSTIPRAARVFGLLFGVSVIARVGVLVWGLGFAPTPTTDGGALLTGAVVVGTRLLWVGTVITGVWLVSRITGRLDDRARRLLAT